MKIVSEINNFDYYIGKAVELIKSSTMNSDNLKDAISVLILARILIQENQNE